MPLIDARPEIALDRILFATDLGPTSDVAATFAAGLARRYCSTLELTNIVDLAVTTPAYDVLLAPALEILKHTGEEGLDIVATEMAGIKVKKTVIEGFLPADLILKEAQESGADLIVLGTSSKHGLQKLFVGSTAEEVLRKSLCPVLTVGPQVKKAPAGPLSFERIVFATDFSATTRRAAQYAVMLAEDLGANLYLCHVLSEDEVDGLHAPGAISARSLKRLVPETAYDWCNPECVVEYGEAAEEILALAERVNADLIVLGARKPSFWLNYVKPGVNPAILAAATCPVLSVAGQ